jgi:hypothetical protein
MERVRNNSMRNIIEEMWEKQVGLYPGALTQPRYCIRPKKHTSKKKRKQLAAMMRQVDRTYGKIIGNAIESGFRDALIFGQTRLRVSWDDDKLDISNDVIHKDLGPSCG